MRRKHLFHANRIVSVVLAIFLFALVAAGCESREKGDPNAFKIFYVNNSETGIVAVDYDPGASEVNQLNRIKLMLATANKRLND